MNNQLLSELYFQKYWGGMTKTNDWELEINRVKTYGTICKEEATLEAFRLTNKELAEVSIKILLSIATAEQITVDYREIPASQSGTSTESKKSQKEIELNLYINDLGLRELGQFLDIEIEKLKNSIRLANNNGLQNVAERFETACFPLVATRQKVQELAVDYKDFIKKVEKDKEKSK